MEQEDKKGFQFRVWDKKLKVMGFFNMEDGVAEEDPYDRGSANFLGFECSRPPRRGVNFWHSAFTYHPSYEEKGQQFLMRWTGLMDRNFNQIFEGDIVKFDNTLMTVEWVLDKRNCGFRFTQELWGESHDPSAECEVVGNIYKDKKLIK